MKLKCINSICHLPSSVLGASVQHLVESTWVHCHFTCHHCWWLPT